MFKTRNFWRFVLSQMDIKNLHIIESKNNINEYCLVYIIWKMFIQLV